MELEYGRGPLWLYVCLSVCFREVAGLGMLLCVSSLFRGGVWSFWGGQGRIGVMMGDL